MTRKRPAEILLVEDNPGDVRLTLEAFREGRMDNHLSVVRDGDEAMEFLNRRNDYADAPRPDLILLDLNLPRKNGKEVLAEIKADTSLNNIPVVVLTTSQHEADVRKSYGLAGNCFITKPVDFGQFTNVVRHIEEFWLNVVTLPDR